LLHWYYANRRAMPWRRERPVPYHVWLSEVMLQQTRVETATPYFRRFIRSFPSIRSLAKADLQDVLKQWEGLGYYSRARHLHAAAKIVSSTRAGRLPHCAKELRELPGLGEYCSAAIASIAFGEAVPVVDGNVVRVVTRLLAVTDDSATPAVRKRITTHLASCLADHPPGDFNQALMELGALVCRPRNPDCEKCPLRNHCQAYAHGDVERYPVKAPRKPTPHHEIAVGVVRRNGRILVARRAEEGMLGGLWEFPGGKRIGRESLKTTARRRILEETGLTVLVGAAVASVTHAYSHFSIQLSAYECTVQAGRAKARRNDEVRWVSPAQATELPWPSASRRIVDVLASGASRIEKQ